jgi:hypothetical protein
MEKLPELTDIYEFSDWLKKHYLGEKREPLIITPEHGGLIRVKTVEDTYIAGTFTDPAGRPFSTLKITTEKG